MSLIAEVVRKHEAELTAEWVREMTSSTRRSDLLQEPELKSQASQFVKALASAAEGGSIDDIGSSNFTELREILTDISRSRAVQGFTPSETATFVLSFKRPVIAKLQKETKDAQSLWIETWKFNELLDKLGLFTTEVFLKSREEIINRQQQDMLELSTPVVRLWEGILALPLIGTLDSARTQVVMESLLKKIVETNSAGRDHRHYWRPHSRYPGCPAPYQDCDRRPADGRGLHHQRHSSTDRADYRSPRREPFGRDNQVVDGRCVSFALQRGGFTFIKKSEAA